mmetsp:Transcript_11810/g.24244  ORF Transcript_11810/g.24244 Transcript_11810/m.24244 type:complete len:94 (-) Transcript_11810:63-344(-)
MNNSLADCLLQASRLWPTTSGCGEKAWLAGAARSAHNATARETIAVVCLVIGKMEIVAQLWIGDPLEKIALFAVPSHQSIVGAGLLGSLHAPM